MSKVKNKVEDILKKGQPVKESEIPKELLSRFKKFMFGQTYFIENDENMYHFVDFKSFIRQLDIDEILKENRKNKIKEIIKQI
jgi:hypothetical protein